MSTQTFVPLGYTQDAIAPFATIAITGKPVWDEVLMYALELENLYDQRAEEDLERVLSQMQFPS